MRRRVPLLAAMCFLGGCATADYPAVVSMAGTAVDIVTLPVTGFPIGSVVGTLAGITLQKKQDEIEKEIEENRERSDLKEIAQLPNTQTTASTPSPSLASSSTEMSLRRVWIDESTQDGTVVAGHYEQKYVP